MPSNFAMKSMNAGHRFLLWVTRGTFGWNAAGMPVIELTTTGRRTGKLRSTMLTAPLVEGLTYVVVASRGGDDSHPAWFLNLRDNPEVTAVIEGGNPQAMLARVATPKERARMWPIIAGK
ncbi:MAG: nitroreductase/quinone reductase family protein, partial [Microbacteriaceae bacterium]